MLRHKILLSLSTFFMLANTAQTLNKIIDHYEYSPETLQQQFSQYDSNQKIQNLTALGLGIFSAVTIPLSFYQLYQGKSWSVATGGLGLAAIGGAAHILTQEDPISTTSLQNCFLGTISESREKLAEQKHQLCQAQPHVLLEILNNTNTPGFIIDRVDYLTLLIKSFELYFEKQTTKHINPLPTLEQKYHSFITNSKLTLWQELDFIKNVVQNLLDGIKANDLTPIAMLLKTEKNVLPKAEKLLSSLLQIILKKYEEMFLIAMGRCKAPGATDAEVTGELENAQNIFTLVHSNIRQLHTEIINHSNFNKEEQSKKQEEFELFETQERETRLHLLNLEKEQKELEAQRKQEAVLHDQAIRIKEEEIALEAELRRKQADLEYANTEERERALNSGIPEEIKRRLEELERSALNADQRLKKTQLAIKKAEKKLREINARIIASQTEENIVTTPPIALENEVWPQIWDNNDPRVKEEKCPICISALSNNIDEEKRTSEEKDEVLAGVFACPSKTAPHAFHRGCIEPWASSSQKPTCPNCRASKRE